MLLSRADTWRGLWSTPTPYGRRRIAQESNQIFHRYLPIQVGMCISYTTITLHTETCRAYLSSGNSAYASMIDREDIETWK